MTPRLCKNRRCHRGPDGARADISGMSEAAKFCSGPCRTEAWKLRKGAQRRAVRARKAPGGVQISYAKAVDHVAVVLAMEFGLSLDDAHAWAGRILVLALPAKQRKRLEARST